MKKSHLVKTYINSFFELFFPNTCEACSKRLSVGESVICTDCLYNLPRTKNHEYTENSTEELFRGLIPIDYATSFFYFNKGSSYRKLIHDLKYKGKKHLAVSLGEHFGAEIKDSLFAAVDLLVPVPLHPLKKLKRGFNQSEQIILGMAATMDKSYDFKNLVRTVNTETQTKKNLSERRENVNSVFHVKNPGDFEGKHLLLVDDVVTTGSTLAACAEEILKVPGTKVSVATLGIAGS